ncbi:hypothetical protein AB0B67_45895, partial [Streptomyces spectabilis]
MGGQDRTGVSPGEVGEGGGDGVQSGPGDGDPAACPVIADPDVGQVVGASSPPEAAVLETTLNGCAVRPRCAVTVAVGGAP